MFFVLFSLLPLVVAARANAVQADLIVITGDIVDGDPDKLWRDVEPLKDLRAKDGVYCVTGNHERYGPWNRWRVCFAQLGLRFLENADFRSPVLFFYADVFGIRGISTDSVRLRPPEYRRRRDSNRSSLQPAEAETRKKQIVSSRVSAGA